MIRHWPKWTRYLSHSLPELSSNKTFYFPESSYTLVSGKSTLESVFPLRYINNAIFIAESSYWICHGLLNIHIYLIISTITVSKLVNTEHICLYISLHHVSLFDHHITLWHVIFLQLCSTELMVNRVACLNKIIEHILCLHKAQCALPLSRYTRQHPNMFGTFWMMKSPQKCTKIWKIWSI